MRRGRFGTVQILVALRIRRLTNKQTIYLAEDELERLRAAADPLPLAVFARLILAELLRVREGVATT